MNHGNLDLGLIRLVAGRYQQMQGLRTVADGVFLLLMPVLFHWGPMGPTSPGWVVSGMIGFLTLSVPVRQLIGRHYDRRFGRAGATAPGPRHEQAVTAFFVCYAVGAIVMEIGLVPWMRALVVIAALTAGPALVVYRDWPYRAHWALPLMAGVAAGVLFAGVTSLSQLADWCALVWRIAGVTVIGAGFLDHALLVKALKLNPLGDAVHHADPI
jgi:hypothetical protein